MKLSKIRVELLFVNPEMAADYLAKRPDFQRPVSRNDVKKYAADLNSGNFLGRLDPLKFNRAGQLIDGQHICMACVESGKGFETFVMYNVPDEHMTVLDNGRNRTTTDQLAVINHELKPYAGTRKDMASAFKTVYRYAARLNVFSHPFGSRELAQLVSDDGLLLEAARFSQKYTGKRSLVPTGHATATYYLGRLAGISIKEIEAYLDAVAFSGRVLMADDSAEMTVKHHLEDIKRRKANGVTIMWERFRVILFGLSKRGQRLRSINLSDWPTLPGLDLKTLQERMHVLHTDSQNSIHTPGK